VLSRSAFTLLDARSARLLERYKLSVEQAMIPQHVLADRIAKTLVPQELKGSLEQAASNITAGLQSMLLIEHWYPGKYSVTCTLTVLPAMVARGTMLPPPAGSAPPVSPPPPRRDNPTVWDSHCKQRC